MRTIYEWVSKYKITIYIGMYVVEERTSGSLSSIAKLATILTDSLNWISIVVVDWLRGNMTSE